MGEDEAYHIASSREKVPFKPEIECSPGLIGWSLELNLSRLNAHKGSNIYFLHFLHDWVWGLRLRLLLILSF